MNLLPTIVPKSDQINADDLIGRTLTIKVSRVALCGEADQPVAIHFEGDNGKPYKPGKSMRRVLVNVWGSDGNAYVGRRMTLYRDEKVQFGGQAVGGIRISHMSDIDREITMALTATRANRRPFTVKPLGPEKPGEHTGGKVDLDALKAAGRAAALNGELALRTWWNSLTGAQKVAIKPTVDAELKPLAAGEIKPPEPDFDEPAADAEPEPDFDDVFPGDRPPLPAGMKTGADLLREQMERGE